MITKSVDIFDYSVMHMSFYNNSWFLATLNLNIFSLKPLSHNLILFLWHRRSILLHFPSILHVWAWWILVSALRDDHPGWPLWCTRDLWCMFEWAQGWPSALTSYLGRCWRTWNGVLSPWKTNGAYFGRIRVQSDSIIAHVQVKGCCIHEPFQFL